MVAQVDDPYARGPAGRPPLRIGQFVEAEISGRRLENVVVLPAAALREGGEVLVVDDASRLQRRSVDVIWGDGERVVIDAGLSPGDLVATTPMSVAANGTLTFAPGEKVAWAVTEASQPFGDGAARRMQVDDDARPLAFPFPVGLFETARHGRLDLAAPGKDQRVGIAAVADHGKLAHPHEDQRVIALHEKHGERQQHQGRQQHPPVFARLTHCDPSLRVFINALMLFPGSYCSAAL